MAKLLLYLTATAMQLAVLMAIIQRQILRAVVRLITIDMVNSFPLLKRPTKFLFHNVAMLKNISLYRIRMLRHSQEHIARCSKIMPFAPLHTVGIVAGDETLIVSALSTRRLSTSAFTKALRWLVELSFFMMDFARHLQLMAWQVSSRWVARIYRLSASTLAKGIVGRTAQAVVKLIKVVTSNVLQGLALYPSTPSICLASDRSKFTASTLAVHTCSLTGLGR